MGETEDLSLWGVGGGRTLLCVQVYQWNPTQPAASLLPVKMWMEGLWVQDPLIFQTLQEVTLAAPRG